MADALDPLAEILLSMRQTQGEAEAASAGETEEDAASSMRPEPHPAAAPAAPRAKPPVAAYKELVSSGDFLDRFKHFAVANQVVPADSSP